MSEIPNVWYEDEHIFKYHLPESSNVLSGSQRGQHGQQKTVAYKYEALHHLVVSEVIFEGNDILVTF